MTRRVQQVFPLYAILICISSLLTVLSNGCAMRQNSAGQPVKGTPQEQALAYNATLAAANNTLAQTVINATSTAPPLLDVSTANKILTTQSHVADADRQLTPLLADTANLSANSAQIQKLLNDIQGAAQPLVSAGDLGIKDAKTQNAVVAAVNTVVASANAIVGALNSGGLLK